MSLHVCLRTPASAYVSLHVPRSSTPHTSHTWPSTRPHRARKHSQRQEKPRPATQLQTVVPEAIAHKRPLQIAELERSAPGRDSTRTQPGEDQRQRSAIATTVQLVQLVRPCSWHTALTAVGVASFHRGGAASSAAARVSRQRPQKPPSACTGPGSCFGTASTWHVRANASFIPESFQRCAHAVCRPPPTPARATADNYWPARAPPKPLKQRLWRQPPAKRN